MPQARLAPKSRAFGLHIHYTDTNLDPVEGLITIRRRNNEGTKRSLGDDEDENTKELNGDKGKFISAG
jgi:hypothetical protein